MIPVKSSITVRITHTNTGHASDWSHEGAATLTFDTDEKETAAAGEVIQSAVDNVFSGYAAKMRTEVLMEAVKHDAEVGEPHHDTKLESLRCRVLDAIDAYLKYKAVR